MPEDTPLSTFGLEDANRAEWELVTHTTEQLVLARKKTAPHAVQVTHQSDGWLCILYHEDEGQPVPIAYRPHVKPADVYHAAVELMASAESLRPTHG